MHHPWSRAGTLVVAFGLTLAVTPVAEAKQKKPPSGARSISSSRSARPSGKASGGGASAGKVEAAPARPASPTAREAAASIGSMSIGHPHAGYLMNAVKMPEGEHWALSIPSHAYGTEETVKALIHCITRVAEQFPNSPRAIIGSLSAERGGHLPPHKSHRTGRDADVAFYYIDGKFRWNEPAGEHNLDRARTWALIRALVTETDVEFILIDRSVQRLLEEHALGIGEDPAWIRDLFHGSDGRSSLIKHVPGHTAHLHIRFVSPVARERGRLAYEQLVAQGHIELPSKEKKHTVVAGDTLIGLARTYKTDVETIQRLNGLDSSTIKVGQVLVLKEREDLRGAKEAVRVPPRRLPRNGPDPDELATKAALLELERKLGL